MSLGAEIGFAALAQALAGEQDRSVALFSEFGAGSLLIEAGSSVQRLALRPTGGLHRYPASRYDPAISVDQDLAEARRVAARGPLFLDVVAQQMDVMMQTATRLSSDLPSALRVRGGEGAAIPGYAALFSDLESGDHLYLRADIDAGTFREFFASLKSGRVDEFDRLPGYCNGRSMLSVRFVAGGGEVLLDPVTTLDLPDPTQIDAALGGGHAIADPARTVAFVLPQLSAQPAPFGIAISGLNAGAADPKLIGEIPGDWVIDINREDQIWTCCIKPTVTREAEFIELNCPNHDIEITEVWTGARRKRAAWEDWDEAGAQLDLEQSW